MLKDYQFNNLSSKIRMIFLMFCDKKAFILNWVNKKGS